MRWADVSVIVLATVFSVTWYKQGECVYQENPSNGFNDAQVMGNDLSYIHLQNPSNVWDTLWYPTRERQLHKYYDVFCKYLEIEITV